MPVILITIEQRDSGIAVLIPWCLGQYEVQTDDPSIRMREEIAPQLAQAAEDITMMGDGRREWHGSESNQV